MRTVTLSLGSNLGNRLVFLRDAIALLSEKIGTCIAHSKYYETAAWGSESKHDYINCCVQYKSILEPLEILRQCQSIEAKLGRNRSKKWSDRCIDIDILFINDIIIYSDILRVPHPFLHLRRFVLRPLMDIDPQLNHPLLNKTIIQLEKLERNLST